MAVTAIALDQPWILPILAYGFIARVVAGPRLSPLAMFVTKILQPAIGHPTKFVPGPPKRFAAGIGVAFTVTATEPEKPAPTEVNFTADEVAAFPLGRTIYWQLGEVVTAVCSGGLIIESLTENPHPEQTTVPGTFTLVANKAS